LLTADVRKIRAATHVILPGVGAARDSMTRLRSRGLDAVIPLLAQPVLGICLGMQLLYEASEEGDVDCLGAIPGRVRRMRASPGLPVPHTGWNQLRHQSVAPLLADVEDCAYAYFVHSYSLPVGPETIATTEHGAAFSSVIAHRNFFGTQFHPERSATTGATVLRNFLALQ
jgi:glutamine amidotransferase